MSIILYPCIGIQEKRGPNPGTSDPDRSELYVTPGNIFGMTVGEFSTVGLRRTEHEVRTDKCRESSDDIRRLLRRNTVAGATNGLERNPLDHLACQS